MKSFRKSASGYQVVRELRLLPDTAHALFFQFCNNTKSLADAVN